MHIAGKRFPIWLVIVYVLALISILGWPIIAFMSIFAFDAPGSAEDPAVWTTVFVLLSYPLLPLIGVPSSFLAYKRDRRKLAYLLAGIAALPVIALILVLIALLVTDIVILLGGKI